jgi:hypothetical protein
MRRALGILGIVLGLAALAGAAILRFVVAPDVIAAPIEEDGEPYTATSVATGTATLLNQQTGETVAGVPVTATRTVTADVEASTDDVAVWDVNVVTTNDADGSELSATADRVSFDRESSEAVSGFDQAVNGQAVEHAGISYKFPFDAEQVSYDYFDTTTQQAWPADFVGTEDIENVETYHYTQTVEPTKIGEVDVPGALLQQDAPTVTLDRIYSVTRDFYVEPTTGTIVRGDEHSTQTLQTPDGSVTVPAFDAELTFDEATIAERVADAEDAKDDIRLVKNTLPLAGAIGGTLLVLGGAALLRRRREDVDHVEAVERMEPVQRYEPEPAPAAPREDLPPLREQAQDVVSDVTEHTRDAVGDVADEAGTRRDDVSDMFSEAEDALDGRRSLSHDVDLPDDNQPPPRT